MILWFKHDLRTHDHPGLSKALAESRPVIAFFCFDPATLSDQATTLWGPQAVRGAVSRLHERMDELHIPMVIRTGDTVAHLLQLVEASGAEIISCESEVEYRWHKLQREVDQGAFRPQPQPFVPNLSLQQAPYICQPTVPYGTLLAGSECTPSTTWQPANETCF